MYLAIVLWCMGFFGCKGLEILEDDIDLVYKTWCAPNKIVEVARVLDGDTFTFWENGEQISIRMLGVAAPEIEHAPEPEECYGNESWDFLEEIILSEEVVLEFDVECTDMYQRTLAWAVLRGNDPKIASWMAQYNMFGLYDDGTYELLVNELMVQLGYAEVFRGEVDKSERYKERMETAEQNAESLLLGLWNECP